MDMPEVEEDEDLKRPLSTAEILARREKLVAQYKLRVGVLASSLLEDPQNKVIKKHLVNCTAIFE